MSDCRMGGRAAYEAPASATEELRALLDERGVEYETNDNVTLWGDKLLTARDGVGSVYKFATEEFGGGLCLRMLDLSPEQAVAATLGSGTCGTRWHELFGTPEGAAKTIAALTCCDYSCSGCPLESCDCTLDSGKTLEWLRGKTVGR